VAERRTGAEPYALHAAFFAEDVEAEAAALEAADARTSAAVRFNGR